MVQMAESVDSATCANDECKQRFACQFYRVGRSGGAILHPGDGSDCTFFLLRDELTGADSVFERRPGRRKRHNAHAPPSEYQRHRASIQTSSRELQAANRRAAMEHLAASKGIQKPDLMVKRHILKGRDIKDGDKS